MNDPDETRRLRILAFVEGASLVVLLGVAVPLKHFAGIPVAVRVMGLVHGLAFLAYVAAVVEALGTRRIGPRDAFVAVAAAFVPFGSFVVARRLRRR